jgi:hypothetical protein
MGERLGPTEPEQCGASGLGVQGFVGEGVDDRVSSGASDYVALIGAKKVPFEVRI